MARSKARGVPDAWRRWPWKRFYGGQTERPRISPRLNVRVTGLLVTSLLMFTSVLTVVGVQLAHSQNPQRARASALAAATPTVSAPADTPTVAALPVLDQEQPVFTGGLSVRSAPTQTFTAGRDGAVVRVDLPLCAPLKTSHVDLTVSNGPNAQSATTTLVFAHSYSDCNWYTFTFNKPVSATAGEVLTLTVTTTHHNVALWGDDALGGNPYPRGVGSWRGLRVNFAFREYVQ
jgi:hypothetical protein